MKLSAALCKRVVLVEINLKIIRFLLRGSPAQQKQMGWIMGGLLLTVLLRNRKSLLHVCLNMPDSVLILLRR